MGITQDKPLMVFLALILILTVAAMVLVPNWEKEAPVSPYSDSCQCDSDED